MTKDISDVIQDWPFDPKSSTREIVGNDGRKILQIRVQNGSFDGVFQMYLEGRPDGKRPYNHDFVLDHYRGALHSYHDNHGTDTGFSLEKRACAELFEESENVQYRYLFLLQKEDYQRVVSDTEHNMNLFRFVHRYAFNEDDRMNMERWWPYILGINAIARVNIACSINDYDGALAVVYETKEAIDGLRKVDAEEFRVHRDSTLEQLNRAEQQILKMMPKSPLGELEEKLEQAVKEEEFEIAAEIIDEMTQLRRQQG